jgi:CRP-like cAMP-binding protein
LKKKEFLLKQGQKEEYVYFLVEGLLHQYFFKGKEMISTDFFPAGRITGGMVSFLSGEPSYYFLQAIEPCELICLSKSNLARLYQSDKKWQYIGRLILTNYLMRQEKEIMDTIRLTMRERYVQFARNYPELIEKVPHRRIASFLNIKPETFSRLKPLLING